MTKAMYYYKLRINSYYASVWTEIVPVEIACLSAGKLLMNNCFLASVPLG